MSNSSSKHPWWAKEEPAAAPAAPRFRGVAYYRHSAKQQQKDSVTIQQEQVQKWAKKNGVALIRDFTERGKTTKSARRQNITSIFCFIVRPPVYREQYAAPR